MIKEDSSLESILSKHGFDIVKGLGNKCFPSCYLVYHGVYQQNFVCKIVSKQSNYEREVYALSLLDHPNIVRLYNH